VEDDGGGLGDVEALDGAGFVVGAGDADLAAAGGEDVRADAGFLVAEDDGDRAVARQGGEGLGLGGEGGGDDAVERGEGGDDGGEASPSTC